MKTPIFAGSVFAFMLVASPIASLAKEGGGGDPRAVIAGDNKNLHVRGDLRNLKRSLEGAKKCHVAFLGGSITQNTGGHTAMVPAWLKRQYPEVKFTVTNAGWGSTCSTSGAFRLESQIFSKGPVDLLIVEFAVNDDQDAAHARRECVRGMEGLIRQVQRDHPACDVVMVHFVNPSMLAKLQRGEVPVSISAHEAVAEQHGVISVNVAAEVADASKANRYSWKDYGGTHPGRFGYQVASNMIVAAIDAGLANAATVNGKPSLRVLNALLDAGSYDGGTFVEPAKAKLTGAWRRGKVGRELLPLGGIRSQYNQFEVLRGDKPGDELTFEFEGRAVGAFVLAGPDAGIVETSVDGAPFVNHDLYHRFSGGLNYPRSAIFASDLKPGKHVLTLRIATDKNARSKGNAASILFFEVNR